MPKYDKSIARGRCHPFFLITLSALGGRSKNLHTCSAQGQPPRQHKADGRWRWLLPEVHKIVWHHNNSSCIW